MDDTEVSKLAKHIQVWLLSHAQIPIEDANQLLIEIKRAIKDWQLGVTKNEGSIIR